MVEPTPTQAPDFLAEIDQMVLEPHRARLLKGMALAITEKGYAAATIADIVGQARVSKRTFYEHYSDKQQCFLDLYSTASDIMLGVIAEAAASDAPLRDRVEQIVREYLDALAAQPALTQTLLIEIQAAGPQALEMRREVHERFAESLRSLVEQGRGQDISLRALSQPMSIAIVGGINELMLFAVQEGRAGQLTELAGVAAELILSVLESPA